VLITMMTLSTLDHYFRHVISHTRTRLKCAVFEQYRNFGTLKRVVRKHLPARAGVLAVKKFGDSNLRC
jgi:hypothetical protein